MSDFAIVVVGYKRTESIKRILNNLAKVDFLGYEVDLIVSIDYSGSSEVAHIANHFKWDYGKKYVVEHEKNLGLKQHILSCGNYLEKYEAIAVLEDDIYVSTNFFNYMIQTVEFYKDDERIAGISLYSHKWSETNNKPFVPEETYFDIYFMQYAQSWGQIWTKRAWSEFIEWYETNKDISLESPNFPKNISSWPESSWLKYHMKFCVDKDKYFVYPYKSLSTNFTEVGQHNAIKSTAYQVPLVNGNSTYQYKLERMSHQSVVYDVFFERKYRLQESLKLSNELLCIDLYGRKPQSLYNQYLLTTKQLNFKIINAFALELRPIEANITHQIKGNSIYLYDTTIKATNKFEENLISDWIYNFKISDWRLMIKFIKATLKIKVSNRFKWR